MPTPISRCLLALCVLALPAAMLGCRSHILRENVLATTNSMMGISLAQSPQTQMYELKAGYARSEFFFVPTSKRIVTDGEYRDAAGVHANAAATSFNADSSRIATLQQIQAMEDTDPSRTPEVLAEIQVGGATGRGTGPETRSTVTIRQRLAVGAKAVESPAAVALMSDGRDLSIEAALGRGDSGELLSRHIAIAAQLVQAVEATPSGPGLIAALDTRARTVVDPKFSQYNFTKVVEATKAPCLSKTDRGAGTPFEDSLTALERLKQINDSVDALRKAAAYADPDINANGNIAACDGSAAVAHKDVLAALETQLATRDDLARRLLATPEYRAIVTALQP